ncbi:hypothetical protein K9M42_02740 [Patescibacteria group bacterium]|nr:hypothetical protein [Patescibacteria group bacterium]
MSKNRTFDSIYNSDFNWGVSDIDPDKHSFGDLNKALNVGDVNIKCFIHSTCPFVKIQRAEQPIVFNSVTLNDIIQSGGYNYASKITAIQGIEGIFIQPRYCYRHNYLYNSTLMYPSNEISHSMGTIFDSFKYKDECKREQSWIMIHSAYDRYIFDMFEQDASIALCSSFPVWTYSNERVNSNITEIDIKNDYKKEAINDYNCPIDSNLIQCMKQSATSGCVGTPLHWRIQKDTSLYRGEDFFIDFFKKEKKSLAPNIRDSGVYMSEEYYEPLNVYNDPRTNSVFDNIPINAAVRQISNKDDPSKDDINSYNFYNQSYYIVELGVKDPNYNYFIIIPEKSYPIFVHLKDGYSRRLIADGMGSQYSGCNGNVLIDAEHLRITVRNHLEYLIIQFEIDINGNSETLPLWKIKKTVGVGQEDEGEDTPLFVPEGKISIWGGNITTSIHFSPLQYKFHTVELSYPPSISEGGSYILNSKDDINNYVLTDDQVTPLPKVMSLSKGAKHYIKLSEHDIDKLDKTKFNSINYSKKITEKLFVQDAQEYIEHDENDSNEKKNEGSYFFKDTIKKKSYYSSKTGNSLSLIKIDQRLSYSDEEYFYFLIDIILKCGGHSFEGGSGNWELDTCKTPILTSIRVGGYENNEDRWYNNGYIDASDHVLSFEDNWKMSSFSEMDHSGSISFLLNKDLDINTDNDISNELANLSLKNFYIEIWAGYRTPEKIKDQLYSKMDGYYCLFTGFCTGGRIEQSYAKQIMVADVYDYTKILQDQIFINSPFYDGVRDINAVYGILKKAGFKSQNSGDPCYLIEKISKDVSLEEKELKYKDGRKFRVEHYALPAAYQRLQQANFKFGDGTSLYDGIKNIAERASKLFYFNQYGEAHFENYYDMVFKHLQGLNVFDPLFYFTTNPKYWIGQQVFNKVDHTYDMDSVYNTLFIRTNNVDMNYIIADYVNKSSIVDKDSVGFVGYPKQMYQREGMFSSLSAVQKIMNMYTAMFKPIKKISFETYGLPIRGGDIIALNNASFRVNTVSNKIDPQQNQWWMTIEAEKFFPLENIFPGDIEGN